MHACVWFKTNQYLESGPQLINQRTPATYLFKLCRALNSHIPRELPGPHSASCCFSASMWSSQSPFSSSPSTGTLQRNLYKMVALAIARGAPREQIRLSIIKFPPEKREKIGTFEVQIIVERHITIQINPTSS